MKEYLPDKEKRILLSALSHEKKLVKDNNLTELIPVVQNLDYMFMYDRLFRKIENNAYQQGYNKALEDLRDKLLDIISQKYNYPYFENAIYGLVNDALIDSVHELTR